MFEKIRKPGRAKSFFNYVVFGLICLVFVFIGIPIGQMSSVGGAAFMVNNTAISWAEYRNYMEILEQNAQNLGGNDIGTERQERMKKQAIDNLLNTELIVQSAENMRLVTARRAIQDKISVLPVFQEEGRFSHSKYHAFLSNRRYSAGYFENLIRKEIQTARFQNMFDRAVWATSAEQEKTDQLKSVVIEVSYVSFPQMDLDKERKNQIQIAVESEDKKELNKIIVEKKQEWKKTGSFDLNRNTLPGLELDQILFDELVDFLPAQGLIPKLLSARGQLFVLKVDRFHIKDKTSSPADSAKSLDMLPSMDIFSKGISARMVFLSWLNFARSEAKIKWNPRLKTPNP